MGNPIAGRRCNLPPMSQTLHILTVAIRVKPESLDAFRAATLANAQGSVAEPGVVRFDVIEDVEDPTRFMLFEVYRDLAAHAAHRETPHYQKWRDTVNDMMAEPRAAKKYTNVFPDSAGW